MRCSAVAREIMRFGGEVLFAVSDDESARFVRSMGFSVHILPGDMRSLGRGDGQRLADLADKVGAKCVLVDTYAVTGAFFDALCPFRRQGGRVAYLDDLFTFRRSYHTEPQERPVDVVVNYSFSASADAYDRVYGNSSVLCLVGPTYAPVRSQFRHRSRVCDPKVHKILVTSGSTNKDGLLENLVGVCLRTVPTARVTVIVGKMAVYTGPRGGRIDVLRDVSDMASVMEDADIALSAAGSTLYELATVGVPTVAVASTDNQSLNAEGFEKMGLGPVVRYEEERFVGGDLTAIVSILIEDDDTRAVMAKRGSSIVDGQGASRISTVLLQC